MEDLYSIHPGFTRGWEASASEIASGGGDPVGLTDLMKAQIASHPRYPSLLSAYIECRKVGAPPEMATMLEEIGKERRCTDSSCSRGQLGADPELDEFMESYCAILERYKEELSKPFDEAATFLSTIEMQLRNLCSSDCASAAGSATATATNAANTNTSGKKELWSWVLLKGFIIGVVCMYIVLMFILVLC